MSNHDPDRPPAGTAQAPLDALNDRLDSWKEIAAYVRRGVRTVQRWERDSGLPIHRLNRDKRSVVFAFRSEIDGWWATQDGEDATEEISPAAAAAGHSRPPQAKPGAHRWFIASSPLLWILAFLFAVGVWVFNWASRAPRLPDSAAREVALPANPKSQS
jgi:hypothetical protein